MGGQIYDLEEGFWKVGAAHSNCCGGQPFYPRQREAGALSAVPRGWRSSL